MFTLGVIKNPASLKKPEGFVITISAFGEYRINLYDGVIPWDIEVGAFNDLSVVPDSFIAYTPENTYTITFNPEHEIPERGYLEIGFPPQIIIPDTSYSQSQC